MDETPAVEEKLEQYYSAFTVVRQALILEEDYESSSIQGSGEEESESRLGVAPSSMCSSNFETSTRDPLAPCATDARGPLGQSEWASFLLEEENVTRLEELKSRIYLNGVDNQIRKDVWKYLLKYKRFEESNEQTKKHLDENRRDYDLMKQQWRSFSQVQIRNFRQYREGHSTIVKDVARTDRTLPYFENDNSVWLERLHDALTTHLIYNVDMGYTQGMNDIMAVLLLVQEEEADAFWCFEGMMENMADMFASGMSGVLHMFRQLLNLLNHIDPDLYDVFSTDETSLYFCFQWFLLIFKREFTLDQVKLVWETIWTCPHTVYFHVFVAAVLIRDRREEIFAKKEDMVEVMKLFQNPHKDDFDVHSLLLRADQLFHTYQRSGF